MTIGTRYGFPMASESEFARLFWRSILFCWLVTHLAVIRSGTWLADFSINFQNRDPAIERTLA